MSAFRCTAFLLVLTVFVAAPSASAQVTKQPPKPPAKPPAKPAVKAMKKDPKWTFEVFGGLGMGGSAGGDPSGTFPAGETFTTEAGFPSRVVPSWFFGDGAALFNEVRAQFASRFNINVPALVPLDPFLGGSGLERQGGASFGARLTRRLTPRTSIEFGLQRSQAKLAISDEGRSAIDASRASFEDAFRGLLNTMPQSGLQVSSSAQIPDATSTPATAITAVVNVFFPRTRGPRPRRPLTPYLSAGAGHVSISAETLRITMRGQYQFRFFDVNPFNDADNVTIRTTDGEGGFIGVFGGGALYELSLRQGLRFDLRLHAGSNDVTGTLDATPQVNTAFPALALPSNTSPAVQFSNTAALKASLSGRISNQPIFTGSGLDLRVLFTVGYYVRF
jgi:hypothetical protein